MKLLNLKRLWELQKAGILHGIRYGWGAKIPVKRGTLRHGEQCDCSGWTRWLLYTATSGVTLIPDGSTAQREWCERQGFQKVKYESILQDRDSNNIYMCFFDKGNGDRHVWLGQNGRTRECYGGHGVGCRWLSEPVLADNVQACFRIA